MEDKNYQILIYLFIISLPIHFGNFLISLNTNIPLAFIFFGLIIVALGLIPLFGKMRKEHKPRSLIQNMLTLGNLILVAGSTFKLIFYFYGL